MSTLPTDAKPVCHGDPNAAYWFPEDFLFYRGRQEVIEYAKAGCARCELRTRCLTLAIEKGERWGIWGGLDTDERDVLVKAGAA